MATSVITVVQVGASIGNDLVIACPACHAITGFHLVARDSLAVAVCRCGTVSRHAWLTEELVVGSFRQTVPDPELAVVGDDASGWPATLLADQPPRLASIAAELTMEHARACHALLMARPQR